MTLEELALRRCLDLIQAANSQLISLSVAEHAEDKCALKDLSQIGSPAGALSATLREAESWLRGLIKKMKTAEQLQELLSVAEHVTRPFQSALHEVAWREEFRQQFTPATCAELVREVMRLKLRVEEQLCSCCASNLETDPPKATKED